MIFNFRTFWDVRKNLNISNARARAFPVNNNKITEIIVDMEFNIEQDSAMEYTFQ